MRYILLMQGTPADWRRFASLPAQDLAAHVAFTRQLDRELVASGELVSGLGLVGPLSAQLVQAQGAGAPLVSQGPFPAARAFVAGYWVVDCDSLERATEIAARLSAAPGRAGRPLNLAVELRPVMRAPGEEM